MHSILLSLILRTKLKKLYFLYRIFRYLLYDFSCKKCDTYSQRIFSGIIIKSIWKKKSLQERQGLEPSDSTKWSSAGWATASCSRLSSNTSKEGKFLILLSTCLGSKRRGCSASCSTRLPSSRKRYNSTSLTYKLLRKGA